MNELALFSGIGGGILGSKLLGFRVVCAVEIDPWCRDRLMQRQTEGHLEPFPIWDDVTTFDGTPWAGLVDIVSGGFPCQDISNAGLRAGISGPRSGLWKQMARIIHECKPAYVLVENAAHLNIRGLNIILQDLASMGFDARWGVVGAHHVGAPHERERTYILAHSNSLNGTERLGVCAQLRRRTVLPTQDQLRAEAQWWLETVSENAGSDAGLADRVDRTRAIGNGQVPGVVAAAWRILSE